jgi:hypothetical protein
MRHAMALAFAAGAAFMLMEAGTAHADPLDFFRSIRAPRFNDYLPDGAYIMSEEDYYRYLKRKRLRRRAIEETYYGPDDQPIADPPPARPKRLQKKSVKPPVRAVAKPAPVIKKPAAVAVKRVAPAPAAQSKSAEPVTASTTPASGSGMSCSKATQIVSGYGFDSVTPQACAGKSYAFNAQRGGKAYVVRVDATSGELTEVKKLP